MAEKAHHVITITATSMSSHDVWRIDMPRVGTGVLDSTMFPEPNASRDTAVTAMHAKLRRPATKTRSRS
jgi:hypothetical protein